MTGARTSRSRDGEGVPGAVAGGRPGVALDEPLLDCEAAAALLSVRVSWVRDAARLGHLPCLRVGRHLRFTRVMLEEWLAGQAERVERPSRGARVPAGPAATGARPPRGAFRRGTPAVLLASLAEKPEREVG